MNPIGDRPAVTTVVKAPAGERAQKPKRSFWKSAGIAAAYIAWTFFGFMLAQAIIAVVIEVMKAAGVPFATYDQAVVNTIANIVVYSLTLVLIIGVPLWVRKQKTTLEDLGLTRLPVWKDFLWLLAGLVAYVILTALVNGLSRVIFPGADYDQPQDIGFSGLTSQLQFIVTFISIVIVAPVAEEVMFRGYLFGKLKKVVKVWIAVILSALLFAVAHLQFNVALDTFALGVVLALLRVTSGSIWASILLHMLKNGIAFYFLFVSPLAL